MTMMNQASAQHHGKSGSRLDHEGFTIIELIIAMAVSTLVIAAIYVLFTIQQDHYTAQSQVVTMQQNLRAAAALIESDFRMAGYNLGNSGATTFALQDITKRDLDYITNVNGNSTIQFTVDFDEDGNLDDPDEVITYSLADYPDNNASAKDGITDLTRSVQTPVIATAPANNRELIAENIEEFGIAYAFDADGDDQLDASAGGNVIWAIDSDNDNKLDMELDTNDDGVIDTNDTAGGSAIADVEMPSIRAARIWILARAENIDPKFSNNATYVIADRQIAKADNYRRRLLEFTIYFRNTGL